MWLLALRRAVVSELPIGAVLSPRMRLSGWLAKLTTYSLDVGAAGRFVTLVCGLYDAVCQRVSFERSALRDRVMTPDPGVLDCCHWVGSTIPPAS